MSLLSGTVLVTGATGGIGQAIARALRSRDADLILTGRQREVLESLATELGARVVACDLSSREDVERLVERSGQVDVLIGNAAVPAGGSLVELTQAEIDRALEVNLRAPIALARGLAPGMVERGRGHIVFVSSLQGKATTPASSVYSASKFGLRGFSLALRQDLRPHGVGVSVVLPGFIRDAGMFADAGAALPPWIGTRRPEDVAEAVASAIERDRAEVEVAPIWLRLGTVVAAVAPGLSAAVSRRLGSEEIATRIVAAQKDAATEPTDE
ncbi:MAG TPA: SDR family NAD(P)-dependent oxidoreductase [Solirubrobacteraceae bacterium]|nr:SDR family NAD(P)-dependent oxidoreductase [Solirubrobacteraceae bacterium]